MTAVVLLLTPFLLSCLFLAQRGSQGPAIIILDRQKKNIDIKTEHRYKTPAQKRIKAEVTVPPKLNQGTRRKQP